MPRFKLLFGKYVTSHPTAKRAIDGQPEDLAYSADGSEAGNMIDTNINLLKFNATGMTPKFERVDEDDPRNRRRELNPSQPVPPVMVQPPTVEPHSTPPAPGTVAPPQVPPPTTYHEVPAAKSQAAPSSISHLPPPQNVGEYVARLEKMSVPELQKHAEEEEIDLKGAKTKVDIIKSIRASL